MKQVKKKKYPNQMLIHDIEQEVYDAVVKKAEREKRSVGKQAEYMLKQQIELEKEKK